MTTTTMQLLRVIKNYTASETWQALRCPDILQKLNLNCAADTCVSHHADDKNIAQVLFEGVVSVSGDLALYEYEFTNSIYGIAPRLLNVEGEQLNKDNRQQ